MDKQGFDITIKRRNTTYPIMADGSWFRSFIVWVIGFVLIAIWLFFFSDPVQENSKWLIITGFCFMILFAVLRRSGAVIGISIIGILVVALSHAHYPSQTSAFTISLCFAAILLLTLPDIVKSLVRSKNENYKGAFVYKEYGESGDSTTFHYKKSDPVDDGADDTTLTSLYRMYKNPQITINASQLPDDVRELVDNDYDFATLKEKQDTVFLIMKYYITNVKGGSNIYISSIGNQIQWQEGEGTLKNWTYRGGIVEE